MNNAHLAEPGFAKNRQIKNLIDEVAEQVGDQRARQLILGSQNQDGALVGGLASEDVKVLGSQRPMSDWLNGCVDSECLRLQKWVRGSDPNVQLDPYNRQLQIRKHINTQIQNAQLSVHGNKHLKADISSQSDFSNMTSAQKNDGQYFNELKTRIFDQTGIERQLLRDNRVGTVDIKDGVMYKYITFEEFQTYYPELANKLDGGFGYGSNCGKDKLAKIMRIEMTNSATPVIHSHPRC